MLRSMTGFGRYFLEEDGYSQTWEIRSVNSRHLDLKWRLPQVVRSLESNLEKTVRRYAGRGRVEINLTLQSTINGANLISFNQLMATTMLGELTSFASLHGDRFTPDYNRLLSIPYLWEDNSIEPEGELGSILTKGLELALGDWNESREAEARSLHQDLLTRIVLMEEWANAIEKRAPDIKAERFSQLRERIESSLAELEINLDESRFIQEITLMSDRLDVSEELTRLKIHLDRMRELLHAGGEVGRKLDFTMQECFREINTCGNKIQDAAVSGLVVEFKNELEKCREQVQNIE